MPQLSMQDINRFIPGTILGASESIDLLAITAAGFVGEFPAEMSVIADKRLRLRAILTDPSSWAGESLRENPHTYKRLYEHLITKLTDWGWEVRIVDRKPTSNCLIIDRRIAIVADLTVGPTFGVHGPGLGLQHNYLIETSDVVSQLEAHFEKLWMEGHYFEVIFEDLLLSSIPHIADSIVTASKERWNNLISYFASHPEELRNLDPRKFEELVAELLIRESMDVELTQRSKDGGRDILATATTNVGKHLYLVECKRYARQNKVGVSIVRGLYGVVEAEKATSGILVTTSDFTKGAIVFAKAVENRMDLKNYDKLTEWLRKQSCII